MRWLRFNTYYSCNEKCCLVHRLLSLEGWKSFIFRRKGCGESFPSSPAVWTGFSNTPLEMSVRQGSPSKRRLMIACEEEDAVKWKEKKLIILRLDFFFFCYSHGYKCFAIDLCIGQHGGNLFWKRRWREDHKNNWRCWYVL